MALHKSHARRGTLHRSRKKNISWTFWMPHFSISIKTGPAWSQDSTCKGLVSSQFEFFIVQLHPLGWSRLPANSYKYCTKKLFECSKDICAGYAWPQKLLLFFLNRLLLKSHHFHCLTSHNAFKWIIIAQLHLKSRCKNEPFCFWTVAKEKEAARWKIPPTFSFRQCALTFLNKNQNTLSK